MPKTFSSSLVMLAIGSFFVTLTLVVNMPEVFLWIFLVLSLPLNVLGIVGIIVYSTMHRGKVV